MGATDTERTPRGGVDVFDSLLVRQPIRPGRTDEALGWLADWAADRPDGDSRSLLPVGGVNHVSLFLDRGDEGGISDGRTDDGGGRDGRTGDGGGRDGRTSDGPGPDALVWYLDVRDDDASAWTDPDRTIRTESPAFEEGLGAFVGEPATVHADGVGGQRLAVHASHPDRGAWDDERRGGRLLAPVAGEEPPISVALVRLSLRPGLVTRMVAGGVAAMIRLREFGPFHDWLRGQTEILAEETVYTESFLYEPLPSVDGTPRGRFHYYVEVGSMERLYDAYEASDDWMARVSAPILPRIFETPAKLTAYPLESDVELLVHAVHPDRP